MKSPCTKTFLAFLVFLPFLCLSCKEEMPSISHIDPRIGRIGDILNIYGKNFGPERNESYITIAGAPPTSSAYVSWKDDQITVKIPEFADAGLVYVYRGTNKSNPALFSNKASMPEQVRGAETGSGPRIASVTPEAGAIGSLVTIMGSNFGSSRENAGVWFSWDAESSAPAETKTPDAVEVPDSDFGYELWSEREIRVRIPDGAISGNIEIRTPRGNSRPVFFEITGKPGVKIFKDKRSYTLSFSVDIRADIAGMPNALYLWLPKPIFSSSQKNVRLLSRNIEPFVENYRGTSLYQLLDLQAGSGQQITLSYVAEVFAVETSVKQQSIKQEPGSPIQSVYTLPTPILPADNPKIAAQAAAIIGRERNPYNKAKLIYDWILKQVKIENSPKSGEALEALDELQADSYQAAMLFCSLARAAGVPALPISGVLVNRARRTVKHYWAEFWIDSFGWIPLDPALGAGAAPQDFNLRDDHSEYYFGNMDNQRVAFSQGQNFLSQMDPRGRVASRPREYALQSLWEEATGGLESYSSLWSDVTITGMYVQ
ncbi:transglutaminase domain-containing protein [Leadbettera azotonutricia]|uniref:IPT/TIG domain protein n=1 Tax=Leadbettera azotonutricia (strain ATCC BAA-888 / DSM 13862 / ZAS-9) TaxID=545695 RepID=F5YA60_LEAAZ|nr:transglutaminase domain-containing protein [Leadbettera azotonutricia]AEF80349.1 IPT/TIG domain protein [Leadbettera azotonutricia ZAS-9]